MNYTIPMQPRYFRRLRRTFWTLHCFMEYRRRLNGNLLRGFKSDPWSWASIWQLTKDTAHNEADSNDSHGWAWGTPAEAVQAELECWTD